MPHALVEVRDFIGIITLDHQAKRNALSKALVDEIMAALAEFKSRRLRVAILRAQPGAKVWSAGHDVDVLPVGGRDPLGWDDPLRYLIREIELFPAPVIAMVEGGVWGGASETVFAYGSNMPTARLRERAPSATAIAIGRLVGHALRRDKRSRLSTTDGTSRSTHAAPGRMSVSVPPSPGDRPPGVGRASCSKEVRDSPTDAARQRRRRPVDWATGWAGAPWPMRTKGRRPAR